MSLNTIYKGNRIPISATFLDKKKQEAFSVVVVHLKSKNPGENDEGKRPENHWLGFGNRTRVEGIKDILHWVSSTHTHRNDSDVLLIGDFNAYPQEAPIRYLESKHYASLIDYTGESSPYSYNFNGRFGLLDYAFATPSLRQQVKRVEILHINADESEALSYKNGVQHKSLYDESPYRSSDHDPIIIDVELSSSR